MYLDDRIKKDQRKLDLLTGIDMLLMAEKGSRNEICHTTHRYAIANNIYKKNMIKIGNCQRIVRELSTGANLHDKNEYIIYIRSFKQALNHGLISKKFTEPLNSIKKLG